MVTTEDVLEELQLGDDCDDIDKPVMAGSDDEFSDCHLDEIENDDNDDEDNTDAPTSPQTQPATSGASSQPSTPPPE